MGVGGRGFRETGEFGPDVQIITDQDHSYGPVSARQLRSSNANAFSFLNADNFAWALDVSAFFNIQRDLELLT